MAMQLPVTRTEYRPNLAFLRKQVSLDRSATISPVLVLNSFGRAVTLFLRHADLWVIGIDFGQGPYHFSDMPPIDGSKPLGFRSDYGTLGLRDRSIILSEESITASIDHLSHHRAGPKGVGMFNAQKDALVRLIFVVPEALRNWMIEDAVAKVLSTPRAAIDIKDFWGNGRALNSWKTWSEKPDWPAHGIFLPHKP